MVIVFDRRADLGYLEQSSIPSSPIFTLHLSRSTKTSSRTLLVDWLLMLSVLLR